MNGCNKRMLLKKLARYSQTKFGYWPKSTLLKSQFDKKTRFLSLEKLDSKELYNIIILSTKGIPTSQKYFENLLSRSIFRLGSPYPFKSLKAVFHKFYLIHS